MSEKITAYCGLICTDCQAFIATQANDSETLRTLALKWYGKEADAIWCICDGCTVEGRKAQFCMECGVRSCAIDRGVINCAYCPDYGCDTLASLFQNIPLAKENLDRIRASL